jgi:hypothetical protein
MTLQESHALSDLPSKRARIHRARMMPCPVPRDKVC